MILEGIRKGEKTQMDEFRVYKNFEGDFWSHGGRKRIVNQREIFEWLKEFGPMTESEIFDKIYNFRRGHSGYSNKKYAECLRRLLGTGKIGRSKNKKNIFEYYTTVENFTDEVITDKVVVEEDNMKSQLQNFDIVQTRNGNNYLVCIDKGILINIKKVGFIYLNELNDDLTHNIGWSIDEWDIVEIYRGKTNLSLEYLVDFKYRKENFSSVWKRPDPKVYSYTLEELKMKLGISLKDTLIVKN